MGIHLSQNSDSSEDEGNVPILSEINITPLTDVFLVLLVIFMVTSSVMSQMGVDVELPQSQESSSASQPEGVILTLTSSGVVLLNGVTIDPKQKDHFKKQLRKLLKETSAGTVIIEGDRRALLGRMIEMMDLSTQAGAKGFSIATKPK